MHATIQVGGSCAGRGPAANLLKWTEAVQVTKKNDRPDLSQRGGGGCQTVINIWSWAPDGARRQDGLTDRPSVVTWLHSVQNRLSSRLLSDNLRIKINKTIILPLVLYGCQTWCLALWKEHRLKVFENRVPGRLCGPNRDEMASAGKNCIMRSFITWTVRQI
jgi:hypothetical protein